MPKVRSLLAVPKRPTSAFLRSFLMTDPFWNAGSFARPPNVRIMVQQIKCQNPVGWFKMQKSEILTQPQGFLKYFA